MASTDEGRALTQGHQAAQIAIGARAEAEAFLLWERLDVNDIDGTRRRWLAATTAAVARRTRQSQAVAAAYLQSFRTVELGAPGSATLLSPSGTAEALSFAGPVRIKRLILAGYAPDDAYEAAMVKFGGMVRRQTMMGGRLTVAATAGADRRAVGWRRVTDGNPCAFCAMLASRGPVYKDAAAADGIQYHAHCGCTAEPAYSYDWTPSPEEERFLDAYGQARAEVAPNGKAINTKHLLSVMRRNGGFRDSPT